jgi:uracil phosphoribosyltransferase
MQLQMIDAKKMSVLYDPELPTANDMMAAICCVATHYAMKPSLSLAMLAADLALKFTAPEYAESILIKDISKRLLNQWDKIVEEHRNLEAELLPTHATLQ